MAIVRPLLSAAMLFLLSAAVFAKSIVGWFGRTESPEALLAGSSSRSWTLVNSARYIASITICRLPTTYQFYADKHMTIEQCGAGGQLHTTTHKWSVVSQNGGDVSIEIDGDVYTVLVKDETPVRILLRKRAKSIVFETFDSEFTLSQ